MLNRRSLLAGASALTATAGGLSACAAIGSKPSIAVGEPDPTAGGRLKATFESIFDAYLELKPVSATDTGLDVDARAPLKARLNMASPADREKDKAFYATSLKALKAIDRTKLSGMDRINYDTIVWDYTETVRGYSAAPYGEPQDYWGPYSVTQLTGSYQTTPDMLENRHTIATKTDAEAYLSRLEAYATVIAQETEAVKAKAAKGVIAPDFALKKAITQLKGLLAVAPAETNLVKSFDSRLKDKGIADASMSAQALKLVSGPVYQAMQTQVMALEAVLPKATHDAGVWHIPGGDEHYAFAAGYNTSTTFTPAEIHQIGLDKVKEINAELETVMAKLGMTKGTPAERMKAMSKDPKFIFENTDAGKDKLLAHLNDQIGVVQAKLPAYFKTLPKSAVTVRRVPKATELGAPGGYYWPPSLDGSRPGAYYINLRDTAEVPTWTLPTLTYHEAIPGHHMQISIQQENKNLPMLRQMGIFNAYVEGWALYAEEVAAKDMGMYDDDPYGRIGYLHDAMFRACRLVVDTGMHYKRWTREQAMAFMDENTGEDNETEIERYAVWPGQALGYMIGKIKWLELRAKMQAKLGAKFDIREFHDTGLVAGAVPLAVLETVYNEWAATL
ncbi:DUF885 family protein [Asticcacaulis sp. YBE204]|uniref:DUF885 domain-containing protein n=1 Tax=Asticcacaulis sp. YBE204 TaxID=1282363 RepID=UPI0003C3D544|nr:DUF885 family protein [Asticcacaulis sp. YBE204]ESQ77940.1 hypothetical protein AEYBE204_15705 [Asticcacaulis sp. YBE204]